MSNSGVENTVPILQTATPLATAADKPNILRVDPPSSYWFWIKTLFLILMIVVLGLNVYYYMTEGVTLFAKMMGQGVENTEEETKRGAEAIEKVLLEPEESKNINKKEDTIESKKETISKLTQRIHKGKDSKKDKKEDKKDKKEEEKIPKSVPSPDLSSHDDLNHQKKQYCYVGNLGGKRHCAEIEQSDKCISGDIFPSESKCVNPNLRK